MTRQYSVFAGTILAGLAMASAVLGQQAADPYAAVLSYQYGQARTAPVAIEAEIRAARPDKIPAIEAKLLAILQSPAATTDCKEWACRQFRQVGSERSVEALAALLADKDLATVARWALQSMPGAKVDAALRDALPKLQGDLKAGAMLTIGARADRQAVPLLAPAASDDDPAVAEAALCALGQIGGPDALRALEAAKVPGSLRRYRVHAILRCAERMVAEGQAVEAAAVYQAVFQHTDDPVVKAAALRGLLLSAKAKAEPAIMAALKGDNAKLRASAAKFVCELGDAEVFKAVMAQLSSLPAEVQVAVLGMVNDKSALPAVLEAVKGKEEAVRVAALGALGRVGDAESVKLLLPVAAAAPGSAQAAARKSLQDLPGKAVDASLIAAAEQGELRARTEAIRALAARNATTAAAMLLEAAQGAEQAVQTEALSALGALADAKDLPALVKLMVAAKAEGLHNAAEQAVAAACRRIADKDAAAAAVLAGLPGPNAGVRCALLRILARIPSAKAIVALRAAAAETDAAVKDVAIRGLADWPDAAAIPDLLGIARTAESQTHKVLALRGLIRLAAQGSGRPAEQTVKLLADAMALAARAEEKKMVLAALADIHLPSAMELASSCLSDQELELEAATAVVKVAKRLQTTNPDAAAAAVKKVLDNCKTPAARQVAEGALVIVGDMVNIAPQGVASSPDGVEKDGAASGDQAAIDGDADTYWDEQDGQKEYRLVVTFKQPEKIAAVSVMGYEHHRFAPKDFEILGGGKLLKKVENAQYDNNLLIVRLDETTCTSVELKITGYYGGSPAVRELGIYRPRARR